MFGLAIIAVGLLFLTFSLIYKCLVARKQRRREAAEVILPHPPNQNRMLQHVSLH